MMMRSPKSKDPSDTPRCSEGRGGVILDGLWASVYGIAAIAVAQDEAGEVALPLLLLGGVHVASAVAGHRSANRCAKANKAHDEWLATQNIELEPRNDRRDDASEDGPGMKGGPCFRNGTCDTGLQCEPATRICIAELSDPSDPMAVADPESPASTSTTDTPPESSTGSEVTPPPVQPPPDPPATGDKDSNPDPDGDRPVDADPPDSTSEPDDSAPDDGAPDDSDPPPTSPSEDGTWTDFWREVRL